MANISVYIDSCLDDFIADMDCRQYSPGSMATYRSVLGLFKNSLKRKKKIGAVKPDDIDEFLRSCSRNGLKPGTLGLYRSTLISFFRWAFKNGRIRKNPAEFVDFTVRKPQSLPKPVPEKDWVLFWDSLDTDEQKCAMGLMKYAGLRLSEIPTVTTSDVTHAKEGLLWVRVWGKGRKERDAVVMDRKFSTFLLGVCENLGPGKRIVTKTVHGIRGVCYRKGQTIGIKIHPHMLRHTYATNLVERNVPLEFVQKMLGHSRMDTTLIYARIRPAKILDYLFPSDVETC